VDLHGNGLVVPTHKLIFTAAGFCTVFITLNSVRWMSSFDSVMCNDSDRNKPAVSDKTTKTESVTFKTKTVKILSRDDRVSLDFHDSITLITDRIESILAEDRMKSRIRFLIFLLCNNNEITACIADLFNSFCEEVYVVAFSKVMQQQTIGK